MEAFSENIRKRAADLGISHSEVARRLGISERRYAHYVRGDREPDLNLLVRIARILESSPDALLGVETKMEGRRQALMQRISAAASRLDEDSLELAAEQVQLIARHLERIRPK